jgi:hypothetical protein
MKCTSIFLVAGAAALFPVAGASEEVSKQIQRQFFSKTGKTRGVRGVQTMQKKFTRRLRKLNFCFTVFIVHYLEMTGISS